MTKISKIVISLFFLTFFILFSCISLWRYNTAQVFYYDFGHFERILWLISRFEIPLIQHKVLGEIHFLGDHFSPSVYLLAPLFWVTGNSQILLLEQALAIVISGYLVFKIALEEKLQSNIALGISFVFLLFSGTENPLVSDWHTESTALIFLLLFLYLFIYKNMRIVGIISALIFIGFKDSNALSFFFILIPYFISLKKQRQNLALLMVFSLFYFYIVSFIITPLISSQPYLYAPTLPHNPVEYVNNFFNLEIKRKLLFDIFASFGFLPLLSGFFILPIIGELSIRLVPVYVHSQSFTLGMHYNVYLGAFLALASIIILKSLKDVVLVRFRLRKLLILVVIIIALIVAKKVTFSPLLLGLNPVFWREWSILSPTIKKLSCVPKMGSVMSQNNILPHLLQRKEDVYLLSTQYKKVKPDFIIIDTLPGQNINNFYSGEISELSQVENLRKIIVADPTYFQDTSTCADLLFFRKR